MIEIGRKLLEVNKSKNTVKIAKPNIFKQICIVIMIVS